MFLALLFAQISASDAAPKPITELPPLVADAQAISPDHKRIAISTRDEGVWVLDMATRTVAFRVSRTNSVVEYVTWTTDSAMLGLLHRNADVEVVDATTGIVIARVGSTSKNPVEWEKRELQFAGSGTVIVAALGGPPTDILPTKGGERIAQIKLDHERVPTAWAVSNDGETLALGDDSGLVSLWSARTGESKSLRVEVPLGTTNRRVHSLSFDPTGPRLAIGGGDCTARIWTFGSSEPMREFSMCDEDPFGDLAIGSVSFSRDGSKLATSSFGYWVVRAWSVADKRILGTFDYGGGGAAMPAWFSSDGNLVVAALDSKVMRLTGSPAYPTIVPSQTFRAGRYRSDGDYAWAVVDHELIVRKIPDEEPVMRIKVREK